MVGKLPVIDIIARLPISPRPRCAWGGSRSHGLRLFRALLYQLSYPSMFCLRKRRDSNPQNAMRRNRFRGGFLIQPDRSRVVGEKGIEPLRSRSQGECPATRRLPYVAVRTRLELVTS